MFEKKLFAGWGDIDFNSHMKNTAYLDKAGDVRMMFFSENGFTINDFVSMRLGPVVMKDEVEYFKEINLLDEIRVTLAVAGLSADGSRFRIRNEFYRPDNRLAARVTSIGGWMDLAGRKLIAPPEGLHRAMKSLPLTDDFSELNSSLR